MRKVEQLSRRTFLMSAGKGIFALITEMQFGLATRGVAIALGGSSLVTACTQAEPEQVAVAPEQVGSAYLRVATEFVNSYVLVRGQEIAIVDTGLPQNVDKFTEAIESVSLGWDAVQHIILTHLHGDHVGGLGEIAVAAEMANIYAGEADVAGINSPRKITPVNDGQEVFGLQIIGTPGHTPGHISIYDPANSLFVVGDAFVNTNGLAGPSPRFSEDMDMANASVTKVGELDFETALFGHGEPIESGASAAIAELATTLQ
ncbi:MAG: MBL fold metallo-hydrolase [Chloroflexota bacterium]